MLDIKMLDISIKKIYINFIYNIETPACFHLYRR